MQNIITAISSNISDQWMLAGAVLLCLEVLVRINHGLLFAGFAAMSTGVVIESGQIKPDAYMHQLVIFISASALWAALLWKPVQLLTKSTPTEDKS